MNTSAESLLIVYNERIYKELMFPEMSLYDTDSVQAHDARRLLFQLLQWREIKRASGGSCKEREGVQVHVAKKEKY